MGVTEVRGDGMRQIGLILMVLLPSSLVVLGARVWAAPSQVLSCSEQGEVGTCWFLARQPRSLEPSLTPTLTPPPAWLSWILSHP